MIQVSTAEKNAIQELSRRFDAKIFVDGTELECDIKSMELHKGACGQFAIGSIYVPYVKLVLGGEVDLVEEFQIKMAVWTGSSFGTYYSLGYFMAPDGGLKKNIEQTTVTAQGRLYQMASHTLYAEEPFGGKDLDEIYDDIEDLGYSIVLKNEMTIPTGIKVGGNLSGATARQGIEILAMCLGGFATEDCNGNIVISKYVIPTSSEDVTMEISGERTLTHPTIEGNFTVDGIKVVATEIESYSTDENPKLEVQNPYFTEEMWDNFLDNVLGISFSIATIPVSLGDFRLEPWDTVAFIESDEPARNSIEERTITYPSHEHEHEPQEGIEEEPEPVDPQGHANPEGHGAEVFNLSASIVPCLEITWKFDGGLEMEIVCDALRDKQNSIGGQISSTLANLAKRASVTEQALDSKANTIDVFAPTTYTDGTHEVLYDKTEAMFYYINDDSQVVEVPESDLQRDSEGHYVILSQGLSALVEDTNEQVEELKENLDERVTQEEIASKLEGVSRRIDTLIANIETAQASVDKYRNYWDFDTNEGFSVGHVDKKEKVTIAGGEVVITNVDGDQSVRIDSMTAHIYSIDTVYIEMGDYLLEYMNGDNSITLKEK